MTHDQNYKNLILDYPRQALAFFAEAEALDLPTEVRITPVRQEQLQERVGERSAPRMSPSYLARTGVSVRMTVGEDAP